MIVFYREIILLSIESMCFSEKFYFSFRKEDVLKRKKGSCDLRFSRLHNNLMRKRRHDQKGTEKIL
jgi:hypothetical protein